MSASDAAAPTERARFGRADWLCVLALWLATCAHWAPRFGGPIDLRYDAGVYYALGTSLAEGRGYRIGSEPGEIEGVQYPPALPALTALHQLALGTTDAAVVAPVLRWTSFALALAYALACYALARRLLRPAPALCAAWLAILGFHAVHLQDLWFTEIPFATVTVAFALALRSPRRATRALAPLLAALAFLLRTAGIALLAAWVLDALARRDLRGAGLRLLASAAPFLAWQAHVASVRASPEYEHPAYAYQRAPYLFYNVTYAENVALLDPFAPERGRLAPGDLALRLAAHGVALPVVLGEAVSAPRGFWKWATRSIEARVPFEVAEALAYPPLCALGLATIAGLVLLWRRGERFHVLYVACALVLVIATPWPGQFARYAMPLAPFLTAAFVAALVAARGRWRIAAGLALALALSMQAYTLRQAFHHYHRAIDLPRHGGAQAAKLFLFDDAPSWRAFYRAAAWIDEHAEEDAVIATSAPHELWIRTGRKAVMPPFEADAREAQRLLESVPAAYLVLDTLTFVDVGRRYARPAVELFPERWERVFHDEHDLSEVYRALD